MQHGGKSEGPLNPSQLKENKNAVGNKARLTTGEYETRMLEKSNRWDEDLDQHFDKLFKLDEAFIRTSSRVFRMIRSSVLGNNKTNLKGRAEIF